MASSASLAAALAAPAPEKAQFLNDMVTHLWPHINAAGSKLLKETLEPVFASMLPGPLSSLRFKKLDLGPEPLRFSRVDVRPAEYLGGINLDMDVAWEAACEIDLNGTVLPAMGIKSIQLQGRLSVLLCPLTNVLPLIGAAQIAFIDRPHFQLDFTGFADIADSFLLAKTVRTAILDSLAALAVLPNRVLTKLDVTNDFFLTYQPPLGILRLTVAHATGLRPPKSARKGNALLGWLQSLTKDIPDCFARATIGAETWQTTTINNSYEPVWDQSHDFLLCDAEQALHLEVEDQDTATADDDLGAITVPTAQLLRAGAAGVNLSLTPAQAPEDGGPENVRVQVRAELLRFARVPPSLSTTASEDDPNSVVGLLTVLIASARNLPGPREKLAPSVKVSWGSSGGEGQQLHTQQGGREFRTCIVADGPGVDIFNPSFDTPFSVPLTAGWLRQLEQDREEGKEGGAPDMIRLALMNGEEEVGSATKVGLADVLRAEAMFVEDQFDVGMGSAVRARIFVRGLERAEEGSESG